MNNNINEKELRFGSYCRKSSDTEDKQVQSIETQERELADFSVRMDLNVCLYLKEEKSAFKVGRQIFDGLISKINKGEINAILAIHPNRLARNAIDGARVIDAMDRGKLLCVKTPTRTYYNTSIDKMTLGLEFLFSKRDSDDKSAFVKNGQKTKALKGYPHGVAAIGFINDKTEEKGNRKWLVDKDKYPLVERIFHMFLTGNWSANRLARYVREELKLTTPKHKRIGGALMAISRVHTMLKDPIYAGFFYQNGQRYELNASLPRVITEAQHNKILRMLSDRNLPKTKTHVTTFAGFIKAPNGDFIGPDIKFQVICDCKKKFAYSNKTNCPDCGKLIMEIDKPTYLEYVYYYNVARRKSYLKTKYISENKLTGHIVDYAKENVQLSPSLVEWSKKYLHELKDKDIELQQAMTTHAKDEVETAEKRKKKIIEMMADGALSPADGKVSLEELNKTILSSSRRKVDASWFDTAINIADLTKEFVDIMQSDNINSKREVLSRFGSNLIWDEEKVSIINTKWMDILIQGLKEAKLKNPQFEPRNYDVDKGKTDVFASVCPNLLRG
ncbi:MAG: recombinase family protein [Candidatus Pacebacteria bacterium]|nr:recombinase family protein [Candidatus Paceibacterota bacterium]